MLSQYDQINLFRIEFERRVRARDNLFSVLLFYVLTDREHADIGEDLLSRHDFDASSLRGFVVARETDDVDPIVGENESPAEESLLLSILIATARFPLGRIADMKPPTQP